jgi:hypothetical protein
MRKIVNHLGKVKGKPSFWLVCPYLVEHVGRATVRRHGRVPRARPAVTDKIPAEPEIAVFRGQRSA